MKFDVMVLGAGIIGVCTALHLQMRGKNVCLVDVGDPGKGTSYGNAGLIERSSIIPYSFPRSFSRMLRYAMNNQPDVRFDWRYLPKIAPWLIRFWRESSPDNLAQATRSMLPLIERCVVEHDFLAQRAHAQELIIEKGWLEVFRSPALFHAACKDAETTLVPYKLRFDVLDGKALGARVQGLSDQLVGAIHWLDPNTVSDPGRLVKRYAANFMNDGGSFIKADAMKFIQVADGWALNENGQRYEADEVVVCLGSQSAEFLKNLGYRQIPFAVKRGYHMHYKAVSDDVFLSHSVCDTAGGFVLAPMRHGIRLTTGIEFAAPDAPIRRTQLERAEKIARKIFPLGERLEASPWLGRRPCLCDMVPVIGSAPRHKGLWFNFGHAHHGLTLGPVSGRLLAEAMMKETPFTDLAPYRLERFKGI